MPVGLDEITVGAEEDERSLETKVWERPTLGAQEAQGTESFQDEPGAGGPLLAQ